MKLKIEGTEYGLQWGMGAIEIYCDKMDCDLEGLDKIITINRHQAKAITSLILSAIENWCEINDITCNISYRKLQAFLSELDQSEYTAIMEDFSKSKYLGKTIRYYFSGEDEPVNTTTQKKSSPSAKSLKSAMKSGLSQKK